MPKQILQFDIPREEQEFLDAKLGWKYKQERQTLMALLQQAVEEEGEGPVKDRLQKLYKDFLHEIC